MSPDIAFVQEASIEMFHRLGYVCDERRATIMDKKLIASLAVLFVTNINPAHAQNAGDMVNLFTSMMRGAMIDRSRMEWSKLPLKETSCIERQLEAQGYSIGTLIQSGSCHPMQECQDPRWVQAIFSSVSRAYVARHCVCSGSFN